MPPQTQSGGYGAYNTYVTTRYAALGAPTSYDYPGPAYKSMFAYIYTQITNLVTNRTFIIGI